jgi:phospholipase C
MVRTGPLHPIKHVFVLMLENHSFDHLLGFSGLEGRDPISKTATKLKGLTGKEKNHYQNLTKTATTITAKDMIATVRKPAVDPMTTDVGHEFRDVLQQLTGSSVWDQTKPYPAPNMSGFAANYATSTREVPYHIPEEAHRGDSLACCEPSQVNALYTLAQEFAVCDNWFSSIPGPTWPNRLFAMAGTSNGLDDSPANSQTASWSIISGIKFENGSIFKHVADAGLLFRVFNDEQNQFSDEPINWKLGSHPIAAALKDVDIDKVDGFNNFAKQLKDGVDEIIVTYSTGGKDGTPVQVLSRKHRDGPYVEAFTWIEPHYGDAYGSTFRGGSSQHPMDSLAAGDKLIAATYKAIRNSPLWKNSLLIITYDEHGGFYDHVVPPKTDHPPGGSKSLTKNHFDFKRLGVRVPAVVVSPYIPKGTIDHTEYDHTSIIRTTCEAFGLPGLTDRDKNASSLQHLLHGKYRDDCLSEVTPAGATPAVTATPTTAARGFVSAPPPPRAEGPADTDPLPESGNVWGFLQIAGKIDFELSDRSDAKRAEIVARLKTLKTYGDAREYFREVAAKLAAHKAARGDKTGPE